MQLLSVHSVPAFNISDASPASPNATSVPALAAALAASRWGIDAILRQGSQLNETVTAVAPPPGTALEAVVDDALAAGVELVRIEINGVVVTAHSGADLLLAVGECPFVALEDDTTIGTAPVLVR